MPRITTNDNKTSYTRYSYGVTLLQHKGNLVTTSVGSEYDTFIASLKNKPNFTGSVPRMYESRPDLISDVFFDSPGYWWYIMQYNNMVDPFEELRGGAPLLIPEL